MNVSAHISSRFDQFLARICPSQKQMQRFDRQVTFLTEQLHKKITEDGKFHVEHIFRSGSIAKHTNIIRIDNGKFDIDLGLYYRSEGHEKEQLDTLLEYIRNALRSIYPPNKHKKDFHKGQNAINITFRTSKLHVDVVPIIRDMSLGRRNSGYIPRDDSEWRLTSISDHVDFVHKRTASSKRILGRATFNDLVRLMKWWNRKHCKDFKKYLCSYLYELLTAAALPNGCIEGTWQDNLYHIFTFLSNHAFKEPIIFGDYCKDPKQALKIYQSKHPDCPVIILDAVNLENNIAKKWTNDVKTGYLRRIRETRDLIMLALEYEQCDKEEDAIQTWCKVFGKEFRRLSQ